MGVRLVVGNDVPVARLVWTVQSCVQHVLGKSALMHVSLIVIKEWYEAFLVSYLAFFK